MPVRVLLLILCLAISASAQSASTARPTFNRSDWVRPTAPLRIAGTIHYVGTHELGAYLITTSDGHILLDGTVREAAPAVFESIRTLGFDPKDIRVLLISQAHFDHVGSLAYFKRLTGARVEVMAGDDTIVESGGRTDYLFAGDPALHFEPVKVERVLHDGDEVRLGNVRLVARHTPGHTPGCTTWTTIVRERDREYSVVFAGSTTVNPGTRLVRNPSYPGIRDDYRRTFRVLESLQPDIFLAAHASFFDLESKRQRHGVDAFVDADGYRKLTELKKAEFERLVAKETAPR